MLLKLKNQILIIIMAASIAGCMTTYEQQIEPDNIKNQKDYKILKIEMKDGTVINLKNQLNKYYIIYEDKKNIILNRANIISSKVKVIELNNSKMITIEKEKISVPYTILGVTISIAVVAGILVILANDTGFPF